MDFIELAVHDLDAPIRKLNVFVGRLTDKYAEQSNTDINNYTQRISGCVAEIRSLIDGLALLGKLGAEESVFVSCDMRMIAEAAIREMQPVIRETKAIVTISDMPVINGDVFQFNLLFRLLLENALKFTQSGIPPVIKIFAEKLEQQEKTDRGLDANAEFYKIFFIDNGRGLGEEHQKIFNPLVRLHGKSEYPGNGLGLSMCARIVANHKGFIESANNQEEEGARFVLILPENPNRHVKG